MRLVIDGQTVSGDVTGVADALDLAREHASRRGRLIIEVYADGSPAGKLLDSPPADAGGVGELGVTTADRSLFLGETLRDARDALDGVSADQAASAAMIDRGDIGAAIGSLRPVVEGWQAVRTIVAQSAALLGVELATIDEDGSIAGLASDLIAMRDAVSREDWSALGDVLAYDLGERAGLWRTMIDGLIERSGAPGGSAGR